MNMNVNIAKIQTVTIDKNEQEHRNLNLENGSTEQKVASQVKLIGVKEKLI